METTTLQRLRQYLESTSQEQFEKDWAEVEALHLDDSPSVIEFLGELSQNKSTQIANITSTQIDDVFVKDEANTLFLAA